ncbi:MAG: hypothetical protein LBS38_00285 [Endomicrobium sp.]|jgi:hypothetical protein|nr:hypothetical protein [Endomicrobium sp.]
MPRILIRRARPDLTDETAQNRLRDQARFQQFRNMPAQPISDEARRALLSNMGTTTETEPLANQAIEYRQSAEPLEDLRGYLEDRGDVSRAGLVAPIAQRAAAGADTGMDIARQAGQRQRDLQEQNRQGSIQIDNLNRDLRAHEAMLINAVGRERDVRNRHESEKAALTAEIERERHRDPFSYRINRHRNADRMKQLEAQQAAQLGPYSKAVSDERTAIANYNSQLNSLNSDTSIPDELDRLPQQIQQNVDDIGAQLAANRQMRENLDKELGDIYAQSARRGTLSDVGTDTLAGANIPLPDDNSQASSEISDLRSAIYNQNLEDINSDLVSRRKELSDRLQRQGYASNSVAYNRQMANFDRLAQRQRDDLADQSWITALDNQKDLLSQNRDEEKTAENQYRFDTAIDQAEKQDEIDRYRKRENLFWANRFKNLSDRADYWNNEPDLGLDDVQPDTSHIPKREDYLPFSNRSSPIKISRPAVPTNRAQGGVQAAPPQQQSRSEMGVGTDPQVVRPRPVYADSGVDAPPPPRTDGGVQADDFEEFVQEGNQPTSRFFRGEQASSPIMPTRILNNNLKFNDGITDLMRLNTKSKERDISDDYNDERERLTAQLINKGYSPSSGVFQRQMANLEKKRSALLQKTRDAAWKDTFQQIGGYNKSQKEIEDSAENRYRFDYGVARAIRKDADNIRREREDLFWANKFANAAVNRDYWNPANPTPDFGIPKPAPIRIPSREQYNSNNPRPQRRILIDRRRNYGQR